MSFPLPNQEIESKTRSAASSPETSPQQYPRAFTRAPPGGFGDRLALARRIHPEDMPPVPPRATSLGLDAPGTSSPSMVRSFHNKPRYGGTPGSYTSPYDIGGKTPGNPHLPTSSMTWEEFEAKHGSGRREAVYDTVSEASAACDDNTTPGPSRRMILFGNMPPIDIKDKGKAPYTAVGEQVVRPTIPEGAESRAVWLGPYKMIRSVCESKKDVEVFHVLGRWLDTYMPRALMTVTECDLMLPQVVYAVKIPMTAGDWDRYNKILTEHFHDACDLHQQLEYGYFALDKVTSTHLDAAGRATWEQLTLEGETMQERLEQLVEEWNLGRPWDYGRGVGYRPELVPVQLGGALRGYPLNQYQ
ncbi:hypothetical protein DE146DRAFT_779953 [Phaeosphaeria sp. MPI-PUGE-AT-0046c]|nr:hypothetical protein DE146DRAFT_779953 [Phaeosphaeria sp. MPI-PUGE-AT-0046c]